MLYSRLNPAARGLLYPLPFDSSNGLKEEEPARTLVLMIFNNKKLKFFSNTRLTLTGALHAVKSARAAASANLTASQTCQRL